MTGMYSSELHQEGVMPEEDYGEGEAEAQEDGEEANEFLEQQEDDEKVAPRSEHTRAAESDMYDDSSSISRGWTFIYRLEPVLSGSSSCPPGDPYGSSCIEQGWGWYYSDSNNNRQASKFSHLSASPHQIAAVRTAQEWIRQHGFEIFNTIFNLQYIDMIYQDDLRDAIQRSRNNGHGDDETMIPPTMIRSTFDFVRVEVPDDENYIDLVLRTKETQQQSRLLLLDDPNVLYVVLHAMRREVWEGGDTWEVGDFGNIPDGIMGSHGGRIQITLSDPDSDWIQPRIPTNVGPQKECSVPLFHDYYGHGGTRPSGLSEMGSVLVFVVFLVAVLLRYCCFRILLYLEEE